MPEEDIVKVKQLVEKLQIISTKSDKNNFLKLHEGNANFIALLKFLCDSSQITNINKRKLAKPLKKSFRNGFEYDIQDFISFLNYLPNSSGTDKKVQTIKRYVEKQQDEDVKTFLYSIACKTLKTGVNVKTLQDVFGRKFLPTHDVQLGSPFDKLKLKPKEEFFLTQKLNGVRCTYVDGKLLSRQGTVFEGFPHIINMLKQIQKFMPDNMVYDGELIRKNFDGLTDNENFRIGTGIINSQDSAEKFQIKLVLFDVLPLKDFLEGQSKEKYEQRRIWLDKIREYVHYGVEYEDLNVDVVPLLYRGTDKTKIEENLSMADALGWEGIMLNKNAPYYCKRTTSLIKVKTFKEVDLPVIGYEEGSNKYSGKLGAIIVDYHGTEVYVGSGFNDFDREYYWERKEELIGKIATVKYKDVSQNKDTKKFSLQFPIFQGFRKDKNTSSYN